MPLRPNPLPRLIFILATGLRLADPALFAKTVTETKSFDLLDLLRARKAMPNTEAIAARQGYILRGIQDGNSDAKPQAGDTVTALVELGSFNGKMPTAQWIIRLQLAAKLSADSPNGTPRDWIEYTNTGEVFTFHSGQTGMKLESLGPIKADTKPDQPLEIKRQTISAATDFLSLDLTRATQVIRRVSGQLHDGNALLLNAGPTSFPASEISVQRPRAAALQLTSEDLRSFSGSLPALEQFLHIVHSTPDLQDILFQVLDKPSLIDVFRSGANSSIHLNFIGGGPANGQEVFWPEAKHEDFSQLIFEISVFKKPVLVVALFVTAPRPPLLVSAGIVGLVAFKPKPDLSDKIVVVRVLSAAAGIQPAPVADANSELKL